MLSAQAELAPKVLITVAAESRFHKRIIHLSSAFLKIRNPKPGTRP
jgi:hypothetical protein